MADAARESSGQVPGGTRWCPHCSGYGSSLKEAGDRCSRCGGTGLVAVADLAEQESNAHEVGRLGHQS